MSEHKDRGRPMKIYSAPHHALLRGAIKRESYKNVLEERENFNLMTSWEREKACPFPPVLPHLCFLSRDGEHQVLLDCVAEVGRSH